MKNIPKDYSLDDTKKRGVFIVSLTHSGIAATSNFVDFRGVDNNLKYDVLTIDRHLHIMLMKKGQLDWKCPMLRKIPEDKPCGRLIIAELPQGEYEFYSWHGIVHEGQHQTYLGGSIEPPKRFKVIAGKAVYLGNLHMLGRTKWLMGRFMPYSEFRCNIKIADMSERDLPLACQKNPTIKADKVVVSILQ